MGTGVNVKSGNHAAPPRAFDARVAASPLTGLRFHLDNRIGDLDDLARGLLGELRAAEQWRGDLLAHLRRNEELRRGTLEVMPKMKKAARTNPDALRTFNDGLDLSTELARADERVAGLQMRLHDVAAERALLRQTSDELRQAAAEGDVEVNLRASRYSQAARQIYQIVDDEHASMARAILDGPMQRLADAALEAELVGRALPKHHSAAKEAARRCRDATLEAASKLSRQINNLDPLDAHHGLLPALRELIASSKPRQRARLSILGMERRLDPLTELTLYRVVEESIENAISHGRAAHIDVVVSFHNGRAVVVVKDDGDGFDVVATEARLGRTRALGLIEMRERVHLVGGRFDVRSILGMGTEVRATVPAATG